MPKVGTANFSDLMGKTNPSGIWSPSFIFLKQALERGEEPGKVLALLKDWLASKTQRGINPRELDRLLKLKPELALERLVGLIGGGMRVESLPPVVLRTLRSALSHVAGNYVARKERGMARQQTHLGGIRRRYGVESAQQIVSALLD